MNGEKILKNSKKTPKHIIIVYIICILYIIVGILLIIDKEKNGAKDPIDFTIGGALELEENQYAYLEVERLTEEIEIYKEVENRTSSNNNRYYIAVSNGYSYIVDLNCETIEQLKDIQEYTYSTDENVQAPEPVVIYGMTEKVSDELKQSLVDYYNESVGEEYKIKLEDFDMYFGNSLLNVRKMPIDTTKEYRIIMYSICCIILIVIEHILITINIIKSSKYIKKNGYEEEIASQLDNNVEEKYYKDKVILTKDYLVNIKNELKVIKYSDVKLIYIQTLKCFGVLKIFTLIGVHLKDGKTEMSLVEKVRKTNR